MAEPRQTSDAESIRSLSDSSSDVDFQPTRSHASRSRRLSRSGSAVSRSRSRSRPSSLDNVHRVASGRYMDDQSAYYTEYNPSRPGSDDSGSENRDREPVDSGNEKGVQPVLEERGGAANGRDLDLEAGQRVHSNLEKSRTRKSERSQHDPKLVCRYILACTF